MSLKNSKIRDGFQIVLLLSCLVGHPTYIYSSRNFFITLKFNWNFKYLNQGLSISKDWNYKRFKCRITSNVHTMYFILTNCYLLISHLATNYLTIWLPTNLLPLPNNIFSYLPTNFLPRPNHIFSYLPTNSLPRPNHIFSYLPTNFLPLLNQILIKLISRDVD